MESKTLIFPSFDSRFFALIRCFVHVPRLVGFSNRSAGEQVIIFMCHLGMHCELFLSDVIRRLQHFACFSSLSLEMAEGLVGVVPLTCNSDSTVHCLLS